MCKVIAILLFHLGPDPDHVTDLAYVLQPALSVSDSIFFISSAV